MSNKHWIFIGVAFAAGLAFAANDTLTNVPGAQQVRNLGYNLGHGNGFSFA